MDRAELSRRLDGFVAENRFTIAVVFPAFGALLMVASAEGYLTGFLRFNPAFILLGTLVSFVLLWGAVNVWFGQWVPALLAAGLAGALVATDRFDFAVRPRFA